MSIILDESLFGIDKNGNLKPTIELFEALDTHKMFEYINSNENNVNKKFFLLVESEENAEIKYKNPHDLNDMYEKKIFLEQKVPGIFLESDINKLYPIKLIKESDGDVKDISDNKCQAIYSSLLLAKNDFSINPNQSANKIVNELTSEYNKNSCDDKILILSESMEFTPSEYENLTKTTTFDFF